MEEFGWSVESGKGEDANVDEPVQPWLVYAVLLNQRLLLNCSVKQLRL